MNQEFLIISIGPVQGFISTGRKSRDLWAGSHLLRQLTVHLARALREKPHVRLLTPLESEIRSARVANKIRALVPLGHAKNYAEELRASARKWVLEQADTVWSCLGRLERNDDLWSRQLDRFPELTYATSPVSPAGQVREARSAAERALDGRKALRDFSAYVGEEGVDKCSFDGVLESVVGRNSEKKLSRRFGPTMLREREHLDAMAVVRRFYHLVVNDGGERPTASTPGVAVSPFVRGARTDEPKWKTAKEARIALGEAVREALDEDESDRFEVVEDDWGVLAADAGNLHREIKKLLEVEPFPANVEAKLKAFNDARQTLVLSTGAPPPSRYLAVISADGDGVGRWLDAMKDDEYPRAVEALSNFADGVARTATEIEDSCPRAVELLYAGGDDLLALASTDHALLFARKAHAELEACVEGISSTAPPTLSVGVAFVHSNDPLRESIRRAKDAEKAAKAWRHSGATASEGVAKGNALGIAMAPRSGAVVQVVLPWTFAGREAAIETLARILQAYEAPHGFAYELRRLAESAGGLSGQEEKRAQPVILAEMDRLLARKRTREGAEPSPELRSILHSVIGESPAEASLPERIGRASHVLLVAAHLARHARPDAFTEVEKGGNP